MDITELNEKIKKTLDVFKDNLNGIQANKVSDTILKNVMIQFEDGRKQSLISVSVIKVVNNKTLALKPYSHTDLNVIEKSISNARLNASIGRQDNEIIITFPDLTAERREELKKIINEFALNAKNAIRDIRNNYLSKNKANSKEENIKVEKEITPLIKKANDDIDNLKNIKNKDLEKI